jgi:hypothetical protein
MPRTPQKIWDLIFLQVPKFIDVVASDAEPLVGMGLLYGFKLQVEAVEGDRVTIEAMR